MCDCAWVFSKFSHQVLIADIVKRVILGTHIMNGYGFVLDLSKGWPREGKFSVAQRERTVNHAVKQVMVAVEGIDRRREEELF